MRRSVWFNDGPIKGESVVKKANGEFEETVVTGLEEIKTELRRTNQRLDATNEHQTILNERQALLSERQAHLGERQELLTERQNLLHEQVVATDKKVDRVITGLSTLLDKVERLS